MKRILIVDDDTDLLLVLKSSLEKGGYEPVVTTSCTEGLRIFYEHLPDLVFLDINVGEEDGREMCSKIKAHADYQHIPVILMSANHDALGLYKNYGAVDMIEKPFSISDLIRKIELHI
jgi:two-component system, OmpR family, response regulator VicR